MALLNNNKSYINSTRKPSCVDDQGYQIQANILTQHSGVHCTHINWFKQNSVASAYKNRLYSDWIFALRTLNRHSSMKMAISPLRLIPVIQYWILVKSWWRGVFEPSIQMLLRSPAFTSRAQPELMANQQSLSQTENERHGNVLPFRWLSIAVETATPPPPRRYMYCQTAQNCNLAIGAPQSDLFFNGKHYCSATPWYRVFQPLAF